MEYCLLCLSYGGTIDWSCLLEIAGVDVIGRIKHMLKNIAAHDFKLPTEIHLILVIGFLRPKSQRCLLNGSSLALRVKYQLRR